jgi:Rod binding domain-containing protein
MGTSSKYPGPRGGSWKGANQQLGRWVSSLGRQPTASAVSGPPANRATEVAVQKSNDKARELADLYRAALASELSANPAAFGLRDALLTAGTKLVGTLESLPSGTAFWFCCDENSAQACADAFTQGFAEQIAGSGGLVADAVVRQAAVACAQELLNAQGPLQEAVRQGVAIPGAGLAGDLFCRFSSSSLRKSWRGL